MFRWLHSLWRRIDPPIQQLIHFDENHINVVERDASHRKIAWCDIQQIVIVTTDGGPFIEDIYFHFIGSPSHEVIVEHGAKGGLELIDRLFALPGFRTEPFKDAMVSVEHGEFLIWERSELKSEDR